MAYPNSATRLLRVLADLDGDGVLEDLYGLDPEATPKAPLEAAMLRWRRAGRPTTTSTSTAPSAQEDLDGDLRPIEVLALLLDLYDDAPGVSDGPEADELWARARELVVATGDGEGV